MVRVDSMELNPTTMKAKLSLEADTKDEVATTPVTDIVGYPVGYTMDFMSDAFTSSGNLGFLKSDGTWNWVN